MIDVRPAACAGQWYPASPERLAYSVDRYLAEADVPPLSGETIGVVAPHAGHRYSGAVAGHAFRLAPAEVDVVVVVGPYHHPHHAPLLTTGHEAYSTPLGTIPVEREALEQIESHIPLARVQYDQEHSLEIELPFLQRKLSAGFDLVPLMLREQSLELAQRLSQALVAALRGRQVLLVASSDLSHFYPQSVARQYDTYMLDRVAAFDPLGVFAAEREGKGFACGKGAIGTVLLAARQLGADRAEVTRYATSGDVTGDTTSVVGYGAAVLYRAAN